MKKYPKAYPENLNFKQQFKALCNTEWSYDCIILIETQQKNFLNFWLLLKVAWKLPQSKQTSQVSFQSSLPSPQTKFRCHLFHREHTTLYTATGARLSQAWELWMLQSCLLVPGHPVRPLGEGPLQELQFLPAAGWGPWGSDHPWPRARAAGGPKPWITKGWIQPQLKDGQGTHGIK